MVSAVINLPRRRLLGSLAGLFVAPAIVRAESLMRIKPVRLVGDGVPLFSIAHPEIGEVPAQILTWYSNYLKGALRVGFKTTYEYIPFQGPMT